MPFGFFKKRGDKKRQRDDDLFDPSRDDLDFDELEASGEFIDDSGAPPPPSPRAAPPPARSAPLPPRPAPPPVPPPPRYAAPPLPPAAPSRPAPPEFDDLTMINAPPAAAPRPPQPPGAPPVPPAQAAPPPGPGQPAPPTRPAPRPAGPPPRAPSPHRAAPPPPAADDDVTMIMSGPVGAECLVAWLVVANGPQRGQDFRLPGGTARVGLDASCDICLPGDTYISTCHAEISFRQGQYEVRDLSSTNGTFVNEARVGEAVLRDNDRLRFGVTQLVFKSLSL